MNRPSPTYSVQNEAIYRADMEQRDGQNVKTTRAAPFVLLIDETDQSVWRVSIVGGVVTAVAA